MINTTATARPPISLIIKSLLRADFTVLLHSFRTLLLSFAIPVFILIIFNIQGKRLSTLSFGSAGFEIALALTYGLMSSSLMAYSLSVAKDREAGVFQRLRVTPAPTWAIMGSRLAVQIIINLIMTIVVLMVGSRMHNITFSPEQFLLFLGVSLIGGAMFLAIAQAVVGLVRSAAVVNAIGRVLYSILLLLGLLGSSGILGDTVKNISIWSPAGAIINLYTGILNLGAWSWVDTNALIACIGYIIVGTFIGIRWFRWDAR